MSLSYVDSGIILRTPAGMGSVMHSQAVPHTGRGTQNDSRVNVAQGHV